MVASQRADVTMLEAGDIYRAGKGWGLIPIMSEVQKLLSYFFFRKCCTFNSGENLQIEFEGVQPGHRPDVRDPLLLLRGGGEDPRQLERADLPQEEEQLSHGPGSGCGLDHSHVMPNFYP